MDEQLSTFTETVWDYYSKNGRNELPWRQPEADETFNPYKIMVSEIMLQQTQVSRVIEKYQEFLKVFPDVATLAGASFADVLRVWSGLGYNRRAKFLLLSAQKVMSDYGGIFPHDAKTLVTLPGIGANTAAAICVYAYNQPRPFIETNIRSVYIYHFFQGREGVHDKELLEIVSRTIDKEHPREWYWALMDYGSHLKKTIGNHARSSKHYVKQSKFEGSKRQLRARVLKILLDSAFTQEELVSKLQDDRLSEVLKDLQNEALIIHDNGYYRLA